MVQFIIHEIEGNIIMSAWSTLKGTIKFSRNDHHCSLKSLLLGLYDEATFKVLGHGDNCYTITFTYSLENEAAFEIVTKFAELLKKHDKNVRIDLIAEIQYLS